VSPPGRPKGETLSAPREGSPMFPPGRPKGETLSAPRAACRLFRTGRRAGLHSRRGNVPHRGAAGAS